MWKALPSPSTGRHIRERVMRTDRIAMYTYIAELHEELVKELREADVEAGAAARESRLLLALAFTQ